MTAPTCPCGATGRDPFRFAGRIRWNIDHAPRCRIARVLTTPRRAGLEVLPSDDRHSRPTTILGGAA